MIHIETVENVWQERARAGRLPARGAIDPSQFGRSVAWSFVLERRGPELAFAIAGSAICEAFGLDLRDLPFLNIWGAADAARVDRALASSIDHRRPASLFSTTVSVRGRAGELDVACMPIRDDRRGIGFLGAMSLTPGLPNGLDRIASVCLGSRPAVATTDEINCALSRIAKRRGDPGRSLERQWAARRMRETGITPELVLTPMPPTTKR